MSPRGTLYSGGGREYSDDEPPDGMWEDGGDDPRSGAQDEEPLTRRESLARERRRMQDGTAAHKVIPWFGQGPEEPLTRSDRRRRAKKRQREHRIIGGAVALMALLAVLAVLFIGGASPASAAEVPTSSSGQGALPPSASPSVPPDSSSPPNAPDPSSSSDNSEPAPAEQSGGDATPQDGEAWEADLPEAKAALKAHNDFRQLHKASPLKWNMTLARAALKWANVCKFEHSKDLLPSAYGENLYAISPVERSMATCVGSWNSEESLWNYDDPGSNDEHATGHFTQVVWKGTTDVGCVEIDCDLKELIEDQPSTYCICEYSPPGNVHMGGVADEFVLYRENVLKPS